MMIIAETTTTSAQRRTKVVNVPIPKNIFPLCLIFGILEENTVLQEERRSAIAQQKANTYAINEGKVKIFKSRKKRARGLF
jgi:hypothetical protein